MASSIDDSQIKEGLSIFAEKVNLAMVMYAETVAKDFEGYAKQNRPWTDRTSRAREGLTGYSEEITNGQRINIAHTVDYGVMLELGHAKRYAILEPTVRLKANDALKGAKTLIDGIKVF